MNRGTMATFVSGEDPRPPLPALASTPSTAAMACDVDALESQAPVPREAGALMAACGGALGTMLAFCLVAGLLVLFDGVGWRESQGGAVAEIHDAPAKVSPTKSLAAMAPDVLLRPPAPVAAPVASLNASPPVARHPPHRRPHHHVASKGKPFAADEEFTNALARAELEVSL